MTDPYTPTTEAVRDTYKRAFYDAHSDRAADFDRWLAAHDTQVREEVIDWFFANALGLNDVVERAREHFALPVPSTGTENEAVES